MFYNEIGLFIFVQFTSRWVFDLRVNLVCVLQELSACSESERRALYVSLDAALSALGAAPARWPRLAAQRARLERLAFALAAPPAPPPDPAPAAPPTTLAPLQSTA